MRRGRAGRRAAARSRRCSDPVNLHVCQSSAGLQSAREPGRGAAIQCQARLHGKRRQDRDRVMVGRMASAARAPGAAGFTLDSNPADVLMVPCPLPPPDAWDEELAARTALLTRRGLAPQLFLPASGLPPGAEGAPRSSFRAVRVLRLLLCLASGRPPVTRRVMCNAGRRAGRVHIKPLASFQHNLQGSACRCMFFVPLIDRDASRYWRAAAGKHKAKDGQSAAWQLPVGVVPVLEAFVMEPAQLAAQHAALDALGVPAAGSSPAPTALNTGGIADAQLSDGAPPHSRMCSALAARLWPACMMLPNISVSDVCRCSALHVAVPASAARPRSADALHAASACRARSTHALHTCAQLRSSLRSLLATTAWLALLRVMRGGRARPAQRCGSCWSKAFPLSLPAWAALGCAVAPCPRPS